MKKYRSNVFGRLDRLWDSVWLEAKYPSKFKGDKPKLSKNERLEEKVLKGWKEHDAPGNLPRAKEINSNPSHSNEFLTRINVEKLHRIGSGLKMKLHITDHNGMDYEVRTRHGVSEKSGDVKHNSPLISIEPITGWYAKFANDFTITEAEYVLRNVNEFDAWLEAGDTRVVIPTDRMNRPTKEYYTHPLLNSAQILVINRSYLSSIGVGHRAINRLEKKGWLNLMLLQNFDDTEAYEVNKEIAKEKNVGTENRLKAAGKLRKGSSGISKIIRASKDSPEKLREYILSFFEDFGKFEVRYNEPRGYNYLLMWDDSGSRIYHTKGFKTKS